MNVNDIHIFLLYFQAKGYFIEDVLLSQDLDDATDEQVEAYLKGEEKIHDFWFEIKFELFQLLDEFPIKEYESLLMIFMDIILQMKIEKSTFKIMKQVRGKNWKTRDKVKKKLPKKGHKLAIGIYSHHIADEITDSNTYVNQYEYKDTLPYGYETNWYGEIRKKFTEIIFEFRADRNLPKNEKIILDSIATLYSKL